MSTEQVIFDYTLNVPATTNLFVIAGGKQGYSNTSGSHPWLFTIYWDGGVLNRTGGGGAVSDSISLFGAVTGASPGAHTIRLTWSGDPAINLSGVNMAVLSATK